MRTSLFVTFCLLLACSDPASSPDAEVDAALDGAPPEAILLRHAFPDVDIAAGEERSRDCQSWTLDNDAPIFVNAVRERNDGAWHHSNWFFVPERMYDGPDGTWPCRERGFSEVTAGVAGGVIFAQSTQALEDVQAFPPGVAIKIPARSRIVGDIHLLNLTVEDVTSGLDFELVTIPRETVETELALVSFTNQALEIKPRQRSEFATECDISEELAGEPMDFSVYYVLPHYHSLGDFFRIEATGHPDGPITILEAGTRVGDSLGVAFDPPIDLSGATGLRMTCGYDNPRDDMVGYGIGDQEMCVFLMFTDANKKFAATGDVNTNLGDVGGVDQNESDCFLISASQR